MQLLVSDSDVENYNMIKECLDILKPLVETSELWVEKASTSHSAPKKNRKQSMDINEDNAEEVGGADPNRPVSRGHFCHLATSVIWLVLSLSRFRFIVISILGLFGYIYMITSVCWPLERCMQVV